MTNSSTSHRHRTLACIFPLCFASIFNTGTQAHDGTWTITRHSGDVRLVHDGIVLSSLSESMTLRPGTGIRTGENGRIMVTHAGETMMVSPNSSIKIPDTFKKSGFSTLLQKRGTVLFEVEKDQRRPFRVLTPYLAAAVKGTQFTVTVATDDNRVEVLEGRVEVTEFRTGQIGLVSAGQTAAVQTQGQGLTITGGGFLQPTRQGVPLPSPIIPDVEPESQSDATPPDSITSSQGLTASEIAMQGHTSLTPDGMNFGSKSRNGLQAGGIKWLDPDLQWETYFAIPTAFGLTVTLGVAMVQRKKKRKKEKEKEKNQQN